VVERSRCGSVVVQPLNGLDRIIQLAAVGVSRRAMLRSIAGVLAVVGGGWLSPLVVAADNCNNCNAPCGNCNSQTGECCSPNGFYCWTPMVCTCSSCSCFATECFFAYIVACDSGSASWGCSQWCWC